MNKRKVTIYSTEGKSGKIVETDSTKWEELQAELSASSIKHNNMKAVIGENRHTLESPNSILPEEDFTLFLMPKKTKAGLTNGEINNMEYRELRTEIKSIIDSAPDRKEAIAEMSIGGKNYTHMGAQDMRKVLKKWFKKNSTNTVSRERKSVKKKEEVKSVTTFPEIEELRGASATVNKVAEMSTIRSGEGVRLKEVNEKLSKVTNRVEERMFAEEKLKEMEVELHKKAEELRREFDDVM